MMMTPPPSPLNKVARIEAILALIPAGRVVAGDGQDTALASRAGRRGHPLLAQGLGGV